MLIQNNPDNESYIAEASQPIKVSIRIIHKLIMKINHYLNKLLSVLNKQHYCDTHFTLYLQCFSNERIYKKLLSLFIYVSH